MILKMLKESGKTMVSIIDVEGHVRIFDFDAIRRIDVRDGEAYYGVNIELADETIYVVEDGIDIVVRELYPSNFQDLLQVFNRAKSVRDRWLWEQERKSEAAHNDV